MERKIFKSSSDKSTALYIMLQLLLCATLALTSFALVTFDTPNKRASELFVSSLTRNPAQSVSDLLGIKGALTNEEAVEPPTYIDYGTALDEILTKFPVSEKPKEIPEGCFGISAENISMQGDEKKILFKTAAARSFQRNISSRLRVQIFPSRQVQRAMSRLF